MPKRKKVVDYQDPSWYFNRELSWLDFNWRVLHEAQDPRTPLLERAKFLSITTTNLDEFVSKRVGGLKQQVTAGVTKLTVDGRTPQQQLAEISQVIRRMVTEQSACLLQDVLPQLAGHGVHLLEYDALTAAQQDLLRERFERQIFPMLTPLIVDPGHPFPFLSNLSLSLGVFVRDPDSGETLFARVKVPENYPRWVPLSEPYHYVPLEQMIARNLERLFPGMDILEAQPFRVTRKADPDQVPDVADDLLELISEELRERRRAEIVRLEVASSMPAAMREEIAANLNLEPEDVYEINGPLDQGDLMAFLGLDLPDLKDPVWTPIAPPRLAILDAPPPKAKKKKKRKKSKRPRDIFEVIRQGDLLVHHPYESFGDSVQRFILSAVQDPNVLAIKQTVYRTAHDSPIIQGLIEAAEAGKQVAVLVELKARFDEARNIEWARKLRQAGAHVAYGVIGLKTHTKTTLVVREEADGIRCYAHIGTGNYHFKTAEIYTDLGLLTCRPDICADLADLFNFLTGYSRQQEYRRLLVAPLNMRERFLGFIADEVAHQQAGREGHVIAKMNQLEDPAIIRALYQASQAGVRIDLVVRGICRLRPGVPGLSDNIRVVSILGRFLEHERIYYFRNGGDERFYFGSADWMVRNLDQRVEAVTPIDDPRLREDLRQMLTVMLTDNRQAWDLGADGTYVQRRPAEGTAPRGTQAVFMERTRQEAAVG
ncbi:MAG: polyphosphate kinase 1 [Chloroflexi bacterium]|nr:polyphosphate kinase 1 [Chloroflexota bacterium]MBU1746487.1 polyphosphate kinase 1 [Chloroflexota bacterium]MBU1879987.1 polyphosphate kinase 1 [Chloroflexota bacterium]